MHLSLISTGAAAALAAGLLVAGGALGGAALAAGDPNRFTTQSPGELTMSSAIVRLGPRYYAHTNSSHGTMNVNRVRVNAAGDLVISRNVRKGERILACNANVDETLARLGVTAGCSGGGATSTVRFYRGGRHLRATSPIFGTTANVWWTAYGFAPGGTPRDTAPRTSEPVPGPVAEGPAAGTLG